MTEYDIPLVKPFLPPFAEIAADLERAMDSGRLTNFGPFSTALEREVREAMNAEYAAAVSSATTGLCLLLNVLKAGSEVILPSFTFIATGQAVLWNRLVPVFADIDPRSLNVSPESVEACVTPRTSAILAVHAFGAPCAIRPLEEIAARHGLALIFDAAHAFGASHGGRRVGAFGDAEVFSLSATKVIPSGEGGLVVTRRADLHQAMLDRRNYGLAADGSRDCSVLGLNGKMQEVTAILALHELRTLEWRVGRRNHIARRYREALADLPGLEFQIIANEDVSSIKDFTIQIDPAEFGLHRDRLRRELAARGIESAPYFWPPLHVMPLFDRGARPRLLVTERVSGRILSLPVFESISEGQIDAVIAAIRAVHCARRSSAA